MPLPLPQLADRDFDQLLEEARNTLPLNAPAWTDHNVSDPGITLLELFAYLTEIGLYRLDRVTPAQYRTFLRLLGFPVQPAQVARTVLVWEQGASDAASLPSRTQIGSATSPVVFQTSASLQVVRAQIVAALTSAGGQLLDHTAANAEMHRPFAPLGDMPSAGDAFYVGFDRPLGPEGTLVRAHVFGPDAVRDEATWGALASEARRARREVRRTCPRSELRGVGHYWQHYSARLVWEYYDASGAWRRLPAAKDRTRALTISGPVHFRSPGPAAHRAGGVAGFANTYFIRARLARGVYDCAPRIQAARINAVGARHAVDVPVEAITTSVRRAHQSYQLTRRPIVPRSSRVEVTLKDGSREYWTDVDDWDRSGPFDRHYVLDSQSGTLRFGNGRHGRVMRDSGEITSIAASYRAGGGAAGNVAARTLTTMLPVVANAVMTVTQPVAAHGGADPETIVAAQGRAVRGLAAARAAVTLADFERIARQVPGAPIVRAHAIGNFHPDLSCLPAAGCVTVVIVPACVDRRSDPSADLCAEVSRYLDSRRPLTCELHVIGPQYTTVAVSAVLHLLAGTNAPAAIQSAREALTKFFDPLSGGPSCDGWPIGRSVYRSEVLALLASLPGVQYVSGLGLQQDAGVSATCGNVDICANGLVVSGTHDISIATSTHAGHS